MNNCLVRDNRADGQGGGMNQTGTLTAHGVRFVGNHTGGSFAGGLATDHSTGGIDLDDCEFIGNDSSNAAGALHIWYDQASVTGCRFADNYAGSFGGAVHVGFSTNVVFDDSLFIGNTSFSQGAALDDGFSPMTVRHSRFVDNHAGNMGAVIYAVGADVDFESCGFIGNDSASGAAITLSDGGAGASYINNCTYVADGSASINALSVSVSSAPLSMTVENSIFWNLGDAGTPVQISNSGATLSVTHSLIHGGFTGTGNLSTYPQFTNITGDDGLLRTEDDDLSLDASSPAIDAGDDDALLTDPDLDLLGQARFVDHVAGGAVIDMGAVELP
jgi:hypothetical protein